LSYIKTMPKFKFAKLVRDKIVEHQIASGARPVYYQLDSREHKLELVKKILEEAQEIAEADEDEVAGEIADVQQAIDDLKLLFGLSDADIATAQEIKNVKSGPFRKGVFVDYVEVDEDDKWVKYYRKNVDRYPEID
jgi:predicted house-cleaning noncanonical NTP pyrophosphatase (MazG superfamily)